MKEKIKRFLTSIGIKNIDDYDLDFDLVSRNNINHDQVDMLIREIFKQPIFNIAVTGGF